MSYSKTVRVVVMKPVYHPHGDGEGRAPIDGGWGRGVAVGTKNWVGDRLVSYGLVMIFRLWIYMSYRKNKLINYNLKIL